MAPPRSLRPSIEPDSVSRPKVCRTYLGEVGVRVRVRVEVRVRVRVRVSVEVRLSVEVRVRVRVRVCRTYFFFLASH